jgi:pyruvate dehydrogenase E2 component (dihydrolipoamide acetyltransferase)
MTDILMPALSPTMEEGTLAKWHVKQGDKVKAGDLIAEIETDKATMEVEAVDEGTVSEILVQEGSEGVKVNTPIARLAGSDTASPSPAPVSEVPVAPRQMPAVTQTPASADMAPSVRRISSETGLDLAKVRGTGRDGRVTKGDALAALESPHATDMARMDVTGDRILASPLAKRMASEAGLDLSTLTGTGPLGRIVKSDILNAPKPSTAPALTETPSVAASSGQSASLEALGISPGSYDLVPLDGMRKTIARRLTASFRDVPHFPLNIDLEIDSLLAARASINAHLAGEGIKVSVNDLIIKSVAMALKRVPEANASFTPDGIAMHHHADIAVAVAIDGGLITPIIRQAETKSLSMISQEMKDLAERARTRKLKPQEFQGGTFSLSNLGMFGIKSFSSIINEPQGAIMSVGAGEARAVVREGALAVATVMSVTLTCDHRVVDGAVGARFLQAFAALIKDPVVMLA